MLGTATYLIIVSTVRRAITTIKIHYSKSTQKITTNCHFIRHVNSSRSEVHVIY